MCKFKNLGVSWPPKGWNTLHEIDQTYGQAIFKNPVSAIVTGLSYVIEPVPIYKSSARTHYYAVNITGWDYNIYNESCEYPVLSFIFHDKPEPKAPKHYYMSELKTQAQSLILTERSAHRMYMAALFLMKQIASGQVPDIERILKLYKIHPTQRDAYQINPERHDSLFCGLPNIESNLNKKETAL